MNGRQIEQVKKALVKIDEAKRLMEQAGLDTYTIDGEYVRVSQKIERATAAPHPHPALHAAAKRAERTVIAPSAPPPRLSTDPDQDEHEAFATYHEAIVMATATLDPLYLTRFPASALARIKRQAMQHAAINDAYPRLA